MDIYQAVFERRLLSMDDLRDRRVGRAVHLARLLVRSGELYPGKLITWKMAM